MAFGASTYWQHLGEAMSDFSGDPTSGKQVAEGSIAPWLRPVIRRERPGIVGLAGADRGRGSVLAEASVGGGNHG
jgi:hypothetical protein